MNFELIDNTFQISVLGIAAVISILLMIRYRDRRFLILALAYACFLMGTLFYTLHLAILGDIPRVSVVAEISWLASYLFFLTLQLYRIENYKIRFSLLAVFWTYAVVSHSIRFHILGPSRLIMAVFALTVGTIVYISVYRAVKEKQYLGFDSCMFLCVILQVTIYVSSAFMENFTEFNFYFAADICLTLTLVRLLWHAFREVKTS